MLQEGRPDKFFSCRSEQMTALREDFDHYYLLVYGF